MRGLWKGLSATVVRVFFGAGIYFVALTSFADMLGASGPAGGGAGAVTSDARQFLAGVAARSVATAIMTPVAVVKTRREWADSRVTVAAGQRRGTLGAIAQIARAEGAASLYSGILPTLLRDAPFSGLYYAIFSRIRAVLELEAAPGAGGAAAAAAGTSLRTFTAGLVAGAAATLLTHPADVLKTRLQIRSANGRFVDGRVLLDELAALLRVEGAGGLLVGAGARVVKRALSSALTWTLFEEAMRRSGGGGGGGA